MPLLVRPARRAALLAVPLAVAGAWLAMAPRALAAQLVPVTYDNARTATLAVGVSQYDLSGTGAAAHFAFRGTQAITRLLLAEASLGYTRYDAQGNVRSSLLIPELGLQLQAPLGGISPYVGIGAGVAANRVGGGDSTDPITGIRRSAVSRTTTDPTFSAAIGGRIAVSSPMSAVGELRVRGIGSGFEGSTAEWTLGIAWRL
jgi:opacity protein-like surface antigen